MGCSVDRQKLTQVGFEQAARRMICETLLCVLGNPWVGGHFVAVVRVQGIFQGIIDDFHCFLGTMGFCQLANRETGPIDTICQPVKCWMVRQGLQGRGDRPKIWGSHVEYV